MAEEQEDFYAKKRMLPLIHWKSVYIQANDWINLLPEIGTWFNLLKANFSVLREKTQNFLGDRQLFSINCHENFQGCVWLNCLNFSNFFLLDELVYIVPQINMFIQKQW